VNDVTDLARRRAVRVTPPVRSSGDGVVVHELEPRLWIVQSTVDGLRHLGMVEMNGGSYAASTAPAAVLGVFPDLAAAVDALALTATVGIRAPITRGRAARVA